MSKIWAWLDNRKTHIGIALSALLADLLTAGDIPESWLPWVRRLTILIGAMTGFAVRSSITKVQTGQAELAEIQMDAMDLNEEAKDATLAQTTALKAAAKVAKVQKINVSSGSKMKGKS